jgi:hypothetical protein
MLSVAYAECHMSYMLSVFMLNVVLLRVVAPWNQSYTTFWNLYSLFCGG